MYKQREKEQSCWILEGNEEKISNLEQERRLNTENLGY